MIAHTRMRGHAHARTHARTLRGAPQVHDRRLFAFKRWLHKLYTVSRATTADALAVGRVGKPGH